MVSRRVENVMVYRSDRMSVDPEHTGTGDSRTDCQGGDTSEDVQL